MRAIILRRAGEMLPKVWDSSLKINKNFFSSPYRIVKTVAVLLFVYILIFLTRIPVFVTYEGNGSQTLSDGISTTSQGGFVTILPLFPSDLSRQSAPVAFVDASKGQSGSSAISHTKVLSPPASGKVVFNNEFENSLVQISTSETPIKSFKRNIASESEQQYLDINKGKLPEAPELAYSYSLWTWECVNGTFCGRTLKNKTNISSKVSQEVCWLTCGKRTLWPYPAKSYFGNGIAAIYPDDIKLIEAKTADGNSDVLLMVHAAYHIALKLISEMLPNKERNQQLQQTTPVHVHLKILATGNAANISFVTDESYSLSIHQEPNALKVLIQGKTFFGVRHGLETLTQLIAGDTVNDCLQILNKVEIEDKPAFPYRGLLIDTARNFIPIPALKSVIDGMSFNKMNMFHWHITDTNSFPFYSKRVPQMSQYGAYSDKEIYKPEEIRDFIQYARLRGVKVIPELDAPAHAGNGWQWGPEQGLGELALCVNVEPWRGICGQPPCGQLNPTNPHVYDILGDIYKDMLELFDNDVFHMGGDEVFFECWSTSDEVEDWLDANNVTNPYNVWGFFQWEALGRLRNASNGSPITPILWNSGLTQEALRQELILVQPEDYVLQIWDAASDIVSAYLKAGYSLIFSNVDKVYIDAGSGSWLGESHDSDYINWQKLYDFNLQFMYWPLKDTSGLVDNSHFGKLPQILGGEATLWSEKVDEDNLEIKIWPRTSALAASLWSNPTKRSPEVYSSILIQSQRMRDRGIRVDRRQPQSCAQLTGHCADPDSVL